MKLLWVAQYPAEGVLDRLSLSLWSAGQTVLDWLVALAIILIAWALARVVASFTHWLLRTTHFDEGIRRLAGGRVFGAHEPAAMASWAAYWLVLVAGVVLAFDVLGFALSVALAERFREILPRVLAAVILLAFGVVIAMALGNVTRRVFDSAGLKGGRIRGQVVTVLFTFFAVLLALEQLGFAAQFVMAVGIALAASVGLALALAFGLGCRDLARDFVVEYLRSLDEESPRT
jgi:hypothetical protein